MKQLDPSLEEAAELAGASLWQRLIHIVFPLLLPSAFAGGLLVFLNAVNELTVSALLWSAGNETLGVIVFSWMKEETRCWRLPFLSSSLFLLPLSCAV